MARVTVEDCKKIIPNRFELVVLAGKRGKDIAAGSPVLVERSNDKNAVIALREIGAKKLNVDLLRENLLQDFRKHPKADSLEDNKQEGYLGAAKDQDESEFAQEFEEEMMSFEVENEDFGLDDDMSFEDENINLDD